MKTGLRTSLILATLLLMLLACAACGKLSPVPALDLAREFPPAINWDQAKLAQARAYADDIGSTSVIVIQNGRLIISWGDIRARTSSHSVRKSLLSALYGIAVERGLIDLEATLGQLGLDDKPPSLSEPEKTATLRQLLLARSGVYHPAAAESAGMKKKRPPRHAHAPGTHWYYNNWDFNVLGHVFEKKTGLSIGRAFAAWIAAPLGMQDFRPRDVRYKYEDASIYPAYPFYISARDMARFGVLFLSQGSWKGKQIIPAPWVEESTRPHSVQGRDGYGYMWWSDPRGKYFYAAGFGGQYILVLPQYKLVMVNRVDTGRSFLGKAFWSMFGKNVSRGQVRRLLQLILKAAPPGVATL